MPAQNYHPGESFRRYDLPANVNTIHFKNLLLRKIVTQRPTGIIFQSRELLSRACKLSFVIYAKPYARLHELIVHSNLKIETTYY